MITNYSDEFAATWPLVEPRLRARLRRRVSAASVDDLVQETATAALRRQVPFADAEELLAWSTTVARRLAVADHRRQESGTRALARHETVATSAPASVEDEALSRLDVERVLAAAATMPVEDRLAFSAPPARDRREAVRRNVRRHRARQKLLQLCGGLGLVLGLLRRLRAPVPALMTAAVTLAAVAMLVAVAPPSTPTPTSGRLDAGRPPSSLRTARPATATSPPTAPGGDRDDSSAGHEPAHTTMSPTRRPDVVLDPPGPLAPATVDARPGDASESELCTKLGPDQRLCLDVPFPATPLDGLTLTPGG